MCKWHMHNKGREQNNRLTWMTVKKKWYRQNTGCKNHNMHFSSQWTLNSVAIELNYFLCSNGNYPEKLKCFVFWWNVWYNRREYFPALRLGAKLWQEPGGILWQSVCLVNPSSGVVAWPRYWWIPSRGVLVVLRYRDIGEYHRDANIVFFKLFISRKKKRIYLICIIY